MLANEPQYILMSRLASALQRDPDFSSIPQDEREKTLQLLYLTSGCDFISFGLGMGKRLFFLHFSSTQNLLLLDALYKENSLMPMK